MGFAHRDEIISYLPSLTQAEDIYTLITTKYHRSGLIFLFKRMIIL